MPDRLKKLKRLRETWALRKRAMELRIARTGVKIADMTSEEEKLFQSLDANAGTGHLFPEIVTRRLASLSNQKSQLNRELGVMRRDHLEDSQNLRRSEILEDRQRLDLERRQESAALEATIEVFLAARRTRS
jgi:hypothetical protein